MINAVSRMKRFWLRAAMVALGASACMSEASAQIGWAPDGEVCTSERTVCGVVTEKKTCVRWKPVTQVCMKRQDCVTYRDECRVGYRPEQYVQCVPKTVYDTVTVDEGCWKMVWCPKPVQKQVARQTVEKKIACRQVPYTYTQKVPQVVSRLVPEYKTKYVPEQYQTVERRPFSQALPTQQTAMRPAMPSCATPTTTGYAPAMPGCGAPGAAMAPGCAAPMSPMGTTPTYSPNGANDPYNPVPPGGNPAPGGDPVPDSEIDPMSYYPARQQQTTSTDDATGNGTSNRAGNNTETGSVTWTTARNSERNTNDALTSGAGSSLAALWK